MMRTMAQPSIMTFLMRKAMKAKPNNRHVVVYEYIFTQSTFTEEMGFNRCMRKINEFDVFKTKKQTKLSKYFGNACIKKSTFKPNKRQLTLREAFKFN